MKMTKEIITLQSGVNLELINGDCIKAMKNIPDNSVDMILADYPFNCQDKKNNYISFVKKTSNQFYRVLKDNCALIIINNPPNIFKTISSYKKFTYRNGITLLRKGSLRPAWHFGFQHNYCIIFIKGNDIRNKWNGTKVNHDKTFLTDVIEYQNGYRGKGKMWHPQAIPLPLTEEFIRIFSDEGDTILDPFLGSGTSAIACINNNRNIIGIEYKKEYYNMCKQRISGHITELSQLELDV
jgi:site-specific DNA-methyltransferase (adenine-specific)